MDISELYDIYNNSINGVIGPSLIVYLANKDRRMVGTSLLNHILIYIQNKHSSIVKSSDYWEAMGRSVSYKASPIWVIKSIDKIKYTDTENGAEIVKMELNPFEVDEALRMNIISREIETTGLSTYPVYKYEDTYLDDDSSSVDEADYPLISLSELLKMLESTLGIRVVSKCNSDFDSDNNCICLKDKIFSDKIEVIAKAITHNILGRGNDANFDIIKAYIREALKHYLNNKYTVTERSINLDKIDWSNLNRDKFIDDFSLAYDFIDTIMSMSVKSKNISEYTMRKAAALLSIMEANYQNMKMRGI